MKDKLNRDVQPRDRVVSATRSCCCTQLHLADVMTVTDKAAVDRQSRLPGADGCGFAPGASDTTNGTVQTLRVARSTTRLATRLLAIVGHPTPLGSARPAIDRTRALCVSGGQFPRDPVAGFAKQCNKIFRARCSCLIAAIPDLGWFRARHDKPNQSAVPE